jgi:hypothetical protein
MNFTQLFLKAKHWHLFMLLFGLPMIFYFVFLISMFATIANDPQTDPMIVFDFFKFFPLLMLLSMSIFFGWFWSIAIGLQYKVPPHVKMKITKFKIFFFLPMGYLLILFVGMIVLFNNLPAADETIGESFAVAGIIVSIVVPMHLFSIFCLFYSLYFVAKTFKTVELQRETSFSDFAGEFFMLWFYPIGVWIIQPKINKMVDTTNDDLELLRQLG